MFQASLGVSEQTDDPYKRIELANRRFLEAYRRERAMYAVIEQMASLNEESGRIRRNMRSLFVRRAARGIRRLQEEGFADPNLDPDYAASALGSMIDNFAYVWHVLGEPYEEERAVATLTRLYAQAIGLRHPELSVPAWSSEASAAADADR
jgi:hypothetical protein